MAVDDKETKKLTPEKMESLRQQIKDLEEKLAGVERKLRFHKARQALVKQLPEAQNSLALAEITKAQTEASKMLGTADVDGLIAQADRSGEYNDLEAAFRRFITAIKELCKLQPNPDMSSKVDTIAATFTSYKNWQSSGRTTEKFGKYHEKKQAKKQESVASFKPMFSDSSSGANPKSDVLEGVKPTKQAGEGSDSATNQPPS